MQRWASIPLVLLIYNVHHHLPLLGGSDYEAVSRTLTFRPDSRTVSVTVPLIDDDLNEGQEEFTLQLVLTDERLGMPDVLRESTVRIFDDEGMSLISNDCKVREYSI